MKRKFTRFLKNRRLYSAFIRNLDGIECNGCGLNKPAHVSSIMYLSTQVDAYDFIQAAFMWDRTSEGHDFWSDLSGEWADTL